MFGLEDVETFPGFQHDSLGRGCQEGDMPSRMHSEAVIDGKVEYEYGMNGPGQLRVLDNFSAASVRNIHQYPHLAYAFGEIL